MIASLARFLANRPILAPLAALAASGALLGGAWAFQIFGGLAPCPLCLYQRGPHWIVIVLAIAALPFARRLNASGLAVLIALFGLVWLAGAGIAGFHVGVEQHWWKGLEACGTGGIGDGANFAELRAQILAAPVVRCDEVPWSLFGISMAGYNFLASLALASVAGTVAAHLWTRWETIR